MQVHFFIKSLITKFPVNKSDDCIFRICIAKSMTISMFELKGSDIEDCHRLGYANAKNNPLLQYRGN